MSKKNQIIPVKIGDRIELAIEAMASSGDGIGRVDGYMIFVPSGLVGDRALVEIVKITPRFGTAKELERVHSSGHRVSPPCPVFPQCGGCRFQDFDYDQQMKFKVKIVAYALRRLAGLEGGMEIKSLPAPEPWHYRNRAVFSVAGHGNNLKLGFLRRGTHDVVDSNQCGILVNPINEVKEWIRTLLVHHAISVYDRSSQTGFLNGLFIHRAETTGQTLVGFLTKEGKFPVEFIRDVSDPAKLQRFGITGIVQSVSPRKGGKFGQEKHRVLWGDSFLTEQLNDLRFRMSMGTFFQVNAKQTVKLYDLVSGWIPGETDGRVLDVYCGNGGISLWLARRGLKVLGIEESSQAIDDARESARMNGIDHCRFLAGPAEDHLARLTKEGPFNTVVLDPPRKGCSSKVIEAIETLEPERIIYVSCNPATLARDLAKLTSYRIGAIHVVDMFPQTQHVETAVHLTRV